MTRRIPQVETCDILSSANIEDLLLEHQHDHTGRDELVIRHLGLVRNIVNRFANRGECLDDLRQVGYIGLLKAADRFDRERGVAFTTYGYLKIIGEIRRYFRDKCWAIRLPRGLQDSLRAREISGEHWPLSLDAAFNESATPMTLLDVLGNVDLDIERAETRIDLVAACTILSDQERSVLRLRYSEELTQKAIGRSLGRSQMYVSRLQKKALSKLRHSHDGAMPSEWGVAAPA